MSYIYPFDLCELFFGGIKVGDFQISFFFQICIKSPGNTSRSKSSLKELLWCLLGKALSFLSKYCCC